VLIVSAVVILLRIITCNTLQLVKKCVDFPFILSDIKYGLVYISFYNVYPLWVTVFDHNVFFLHYNKRCGGKRTKNVTLITYVYIYIHVCTTLFKFLS
jgi:hypothetical protein